MGLSFQVRDDQGAVVVSPRGKLILDTGTALHDEVKRHVARGARHIVVDLASVPYVDSHGLGQLVACHATLVNGGGRTRFAGLARKVMTLLEMTHVPAVLGFDPDVATALRKLSES